MVGGLRGPPLVGTIVERTRPSIAVAMARPRRTRYATANDILASARECGCDRKSFRQLPGQRALKLLDRILGAFTVGGLRNRKAMWLWEDFRGPEFSVQGPHDLDDLLSLGPGETPVWLVVEDRHRAKRGTAFWIFEGTLASTIATLSNSFCIEFYIVGRSFDWLIAENHHEYLIAVGDRAVAALKRLAPRC